LYFRRLTSKKGGKPGRGKQGKEGRERVGKREKKETRSPIHDSGSATEKQKEGKAAKN